MKKIIIPCLCLISAFSLTGCTNASNQTLTSLNNQIERVDNIVSSTNISEVSDVSPDVTLSSNESYNSIQNFRSLSNENMLREEEIRQDILRLTAQLKCCSGQKYKLSKKKNNALKTITNNLSKYSGYLNQSKIQVKSSVAKIKRNLKVPNINIEEASSSYISLNNSMNERYAYLTNIHDNLEQACIILECDYCKQNSCENCQNDENKESNIDINFENQNNVDKTNEFNKLYEPSQTSDEIDEQKGSFKIVKNIDSYGPTESNTINNSDTNQTAINNTSPTNNQIPSSNQPIYNNQLPHNTPYPNTPIPRPYPTGNYPHNIRNNRFWNGYNQANPNRNTDTFYSLNRNIDTYRYNPNFYNYNYNFPY